MLAVGTSLAVRVTFSPGTTISCHPSRPANAELVKAIEWSPAFRRASLRRVHSSRNVERPACPGGKVSDAGPSATTDKVASSRRSRTSEAAFAHAARRHTSASMLLTAPSWSVSISPRACTVGISASSVIISTVTAFDQKWIAVYWLIVKFPSGWAPALAAGATAMAAAIASPTRARLISCLPQDAVRWW